MIKFFKNFRKDEDGAVTVDWVVLTAAVVALAAIAYNQVRSGASELAGNIEDALGSVTVTTPNTN
ncbi:hypothetical protein SAMN05444358_10118 [Ruegeria halocynthiae]|uniref:Flp pilus assembly protein, pilin Flp n=1 Tax=Ruegeria halocynthiae TaxID=985054 RepID=A0A1H2R296_9RHOB|nr:hypothetical protein [Ruegeria halocynthiae]SDW13481.1 hypothetical protein SAMN05444358_10118 [Ruegeria halocynthiae]